MKMKNIFIALSFVLSGITLFAQNKDTKTADKLFSRYEYVAATKAYLKLVENNTANAYVYKQRPEKYGPSLDGQKHYNVIKPGQNIDIFLSVKPYVPDSTKTPQDLSMPKE